MPNKNIQQFIKGLIINSIPKNKVIGSIEHRIDPFTAGLLLSCSKDPDNMLNMYKELTSTNGTLKFGEGPNEEQKKFVQDNLDKKVRIKNTSHIGTIIGLNNSTYGLYNGSRYPVYVQITSSSDERAIGEVFEYGIDFIELIEI